MFCINYFVIIFYALFANFLYGFSIEVVNPRNRTVSNNNNEIRVRVQEGIEYIPEGADIFLSCPNNPTHIGNNQFRRCNLERLATSPIQKK